MRVFGVSVVRNEADILRINVRHHLALGIDKFLIIDNGSTDGTLDVLRELSDSGSVQWTSADGEFRQAELTTMLAREAFLQGADWILPIDADEFWYAPSGDFRQVLERSAAAALQVRIVNYVQSRRQLDRSPAALLSLTMRTPFPTGPIERIEELVVTQQIAFVEISYPPKWVSRASFGLAIETGNHWTTGISGPREETGDIVCLHAPLRSRSVLEAKIEWTRPVEEVSQYWEQAWHIRRWRRLGEKDRDWLDREWRANSYAEDRLDLYGVPHGLIYDSTLRDVLAPLIASDVETSADEMSVLSPTPKLELGRHLGFSQYEPVSRAFSQMRDVEGWLFEPEAGLLMATAALALTQSEPHAVVEVGSYCGRSTVILGNAVSAVCPGAKVYAIDPHEGEITCGGGLTTTRAASTLSKFMENIAAAGLSDAVQLIQKRSFDVAWQQPISLLFIDALHDYANVSCDFAHFAPWLVDGGYIVFDDYDPSFPGVVRFVDELCSSRQYRNVQQVGRMVALRNEASRISGSRQGVQSNPSAGRGTSTGESQARGGAGASATGMDVSDESSRVDLPLLQDRVSRQERALATLWGIVGEETARREQMLADLTGQLQATVAGRDRLVSDRDALITDLQAAVTERDRAISDLQAQLSAARETVTRMQDVPVQLQAAVTERDRAISDLQAQLSAARETVTRMQLARVWHLTALYDRVRRWPKSWWLARRL